MSGSEGRLDQDGVAALLTRPAALGGAGLALSGCQATAPPASGAIAGRVESEPDPAVFNVTNTHYYPSIADGNTVGSPGANTAYRGAPRTYAATLELQF